MDIAWFEKRRWVYRPIDPVGWLIALLTAAACVWVFWAVDRKSHSVSDTLIGAFPYVISFLVVFGWVAANTCRAPAPNDPV
jgi:hypothetical protein